MRIRSPLIFLALLTGFCSPAPLLPRSSVPHPPARAAATLELYGTFHAMGVIVTLDTSDDPDRDATATVEYRTGGESYHAGFPLSRVSGTRFAGSLFWLEPGTAYDVRITFSDPDGSLHNVTVDGTASTRAEIAIPAPSHSYYVAPGGSGTACSEGAPCSLEQGLNQAQAGEEVVLRGGTYYEGEISAPRSGTSNAPILVRGYDGETAIMDGGDPATFSWTAQGGGVYRATVNEPDTHLVTANGERLLPYQSLSDLQNLIWGVPGFYVEGTTLYVRLAGDADPSDAAMVISRYNNAFYVGQDFIYFLDLTFRHYGQGSWAKAIYFDDANDNLVQGCTFAINDLGIGIKRASHRNVIQDSEFYDTVFDWPWDAFYAGISLSSGGIRFYSPTTGRGTVIRRNTFHDYFDGFGACPNETGGETNETDVYENLVYRAGDDGMETDGRCSNVRLWSNTFHDVLMGISLAPTYTGPTYAIRNLIYRTGVGNNDYTGSPFKFNSGYDTSGPMYLFHNTSDAALPGNNGIYVKAPGTWEMIYARNNVWSGTDYALNNYNTGQPIDLDYDDLWNDGANDLVRWDNVRYDTLAAFTAATGQEPHGLDVEPGFAGAGSGDYTLNPTSDLIDAGVVIPGINDDYVGAAPDIGAFEYQSYGFTLAADPSSRAIAPGGVATYTVGVQPVGGFSATVNLVTASSPPGLILGLAPTAVTPLDMATLTVTDTHTGTSLLPGLRYTISITGTSGAITQSTSVSLLVGGERLYLPLLLRHYDPMSLTFGNWTPRPKEPVLENSPNATSFATMWPSDLPTLSATAATFSIPLAVKERYGTNRSDEPVTYGVPFSRDMDVTTTDVLQVTNASGTPIPAQFRVLSRYDGPISDTVKPIRVVLVDFQTNVNANQTKTFYLNDGGTGTVPGTLLASEDSTHVVISTGKLVARISKNNFNLFDQVYIDKDNDGEVNDQIIYSNPTDGIIVNYQGVDYTSNHTPTEVVIEENGPLRAVVKVRGYFQNSLDGKVYPPLGDVGLSYTVRFKAYKDQPYLKVDFTLENENMGWTHDVNYPAHHVYLDSVRLKTTLDLNISRTVRLETYEDISSGDDHVLLQDHQENTIDESGNFTYSIQKGGLDVDGGQRAAGVVDLRDDEKGLMIGTRWFWQNWPKAIQVNDTTIDYFLWPDMSYDHKFLGAAYKTHEMIYYFHPVVSGGFDFAPQVATLQKRLIARASDTYYAGTGFMGFIPPGTITTPYTFPRGESLQVAIDRWNRQIRAKYDASYVNGPGSQHYQATITSLREDRPLAWTSGPLTGQQMNWYGWLVFGDMARSGSYGFPALHYSWDHISLFHSMRFNDYDMFDVGEEMVNYKADVAIIHDPTGTDESGAWDQDYYRGSSRYEADALMHVGDTFAGAGATNSPRGASHLWAKGLILHYLMTGDERYYDVLEQVGEHLVYAFSTGGRAGTSCDSSPCYTVEVRHQGRAINNLVDLWKVTGDQTYLTVANNIFVNGILPYERNGSEGYTWFQMGNAPDYCGGDQCDAHMFYESVIIEPLINLYYALQEKDPVQATAVREYLARHAIWMRDKVYTNYQEADGGTYSGNQYFPYCTKIDWEDGYLWPPGQGYDDATYSFAFADNFAFMYRETGDINWLNLARAVFKDLLMYQCGTYQDINFSTDVTASGFQNSPYSAYLKEGKLRTKPMVYLYTEWEVFQSPGLVLKGTPADQSILLTWTVSGTLPATSTWQIDYQSQTGTLYTPVTGIISPTRAYTLTGLTNYVWYTVTLNGMLGSASFLADTVRVMPTDISVYLPLLLRGQ